ncbi:MAG: quinolinate synthase NadA [Dehalococcoidia bacterium]|nr:quinolinate synthase NadA [Dehalococcoidia bacterium]
MRRAQTAVRPSSNLEELQQKIQELKKKLNAVIVAHNYQRPEVQDVADFVGDSLELARRCAEIEAEIIVFCGVRFMAETVAILNPSRTVLLSHPTAGCPLADMITVEDVRDWKASYPQATVVAYVNTTATIKAESDICCTSASGVKVVESVPNNEILFIPDQHLGHYISTKTEKRVILYPGFCATHARLNAKQVKLARRLHPEAEVLVHPECRAEVIALADAALSTSQMIRYAKESPASSFLVGTEEGILHPLRGANPGKGFHLIASSLICPDMKKTRLETVIETMELKQNVVTVPEGIRPKAKQAIDRMLAIA